MSETQKVCELIASQIRSERFRRVYQGGHHDVYCNGRQHVTLIGSAYGTAPLDHNTLARIRLGRCDCAEYLLRSDEP